jgi:hypothetical protein
MRRSVHIAIAATSVLVVMSACKGRPVRLVVGRRDTVIISSGTPFALAARVFDAAGRDLPMTGVRYVWTSGAPVAVSPTGTVTCAQRGDAEVRASVDGAATNVHLLCRPLRELRTPGVMELVLGDSAQDLPVAALGLDGQPVALIGGSATIGDTNIATLDGFRIRARAPGNTLVEVKAGEHVARVGVLVYERVRTLDSLRPQQRNVIVSVHLASGESRRWRLAGGTYFLAILPDDMGRQRPQLATIGANCMPTVGERHYICLGQNDASVIVYNPAGSKQDADGEVAVERLVKP